MVWCIAVSSDNKLIIYTVTGSDDTLILHFDNYVKGCTTVLFSFQYKNKSKQTCQENFHQFIVNFIIIPSFRQSSMQKPSKKSISEQIVSKKSIKNIPYGYLVIKVLFNLKKIKTKLKWVYYNIHNTSPIS